MNIILAATDKKAILIFSTILVVADALCAWKARGVIRNLPEYPSMAVYLMVYAVFGYLFWYSLFLTSARSFLFTLSVTLVAISNCVLEKYCILSHGAAYRTVIASAFNTTVEQAKSYLAPSLLVVLLLIVCMVALFAASAHIRKAGWKEKRRSLFLFLLSVFLPLLLCKGHLLGLPDAAYVLSTYTKKCEPWPTWIGEETIMQDGLADNPVFRACVDRETPENVYLPYRRETLWLTYAMENLCPPTFRDSASAPSKCSLAAGEEVTVVLYIMESFRADHSPFSGYHRNTLPNLYGHCAGNIIVLPGMRSFGTHTRQSLYGLLSDACENDREARHTSWQAIFRKHGYHCSFLENCTDGAMMSTTPLFRSLLNGCYDRLVTVEKSNDFASLAGEDLGHHPLNMCIIFDGYGHYPYEGESGTVWGNEPVDLYDESRLTHDAAAYGFIKSLQDKTVIVLIIGDHGESFGEGGRTFHGSTLDAAEQRHVLALVWYSDAYARRFPEIVQNLRDNAEAFNSHDQIFHTMPSMGGIHSSLRDPAMDMTEPRQGTQNAGRKE